MKREYKEPMYTISIVAKLLKVCQATLRLWEKKGLLKPQRLGKNRFYSEEDIDRLEIIKDLVQNKKISLEGAKQMINIKNCWDINKCNVQLRNKCKVYRILKKNVHG